MTAMKTLSMYIRAAKTEAEEAGIATDGMANSVSELRNDILALTGERVDIMVDDNTFKSTVDVLRELSQVWGELTDTTRANITELIGGGVRNANVVSALINNFARVEEVLAASADAAGSALAENEKYLDSIAGKTAIFQATYHELATNLFDSSTVKGVIDFGTWLLKILDTISELLETIGGLKTVLVGVAGIIAAINLESIKKKIVSFGSSVASVTSVFGKLWKAVKTHKEVQGDFASGTQRMDAALKKVGISASTAQIALGALTTVITIAVAAYSAHQQKLEEQRAAATEAANAMQENAEAVEEYKDRIYELRTAIDSGNLSEEEAYNKRLELLSIQDALVEMYGDEAKSIDLVTSSIYKQIDAIDTLSRKELDEFSKRNAGAINEAVSLFTNFDPFKVDFWGTAFKSAVGKPVIEMPDFLLAINELGLDQSIGELQKELADALKDAGLANRLLPSGVGLNLVSDIDIRNIYEALDVYTRLYEVTEEFGRQKFGSDYWGYVGGALEGYSNYITKIEDAIAESEEIFNAYAERTLLYEKEYSDIWSRVLAAEREYSNAILGGDEEAAAQALKRMEALQEAVLNAGWDNEAVNVYVGEFFDAWNEQTKQYAFRVDVEARLKDNGDQLGNDLRNAVGAFANDDGVIDASRILNAGLTRGAGYSREEEKAYHTLSQAARRYRVSVKELITLLTELGYVQNALGTGAYAAYKEPIEDLTAVLSQSQTMYEAMETAQEEMRKGQGLSAETLKQLSNANAEYLQYLYEENGVILLNTEAWKANADAQMEREVSKIQAAIESLNKENESLEEQNAALRENIVLYQKKKQNAKDETAYDEMIEEATQQLQSNSAAIAENSEKVLEYEKLLGVYSASYEELVSSAKTYGTQISDLSDTISQMQTAYNAMETAQSEMAAGQSLSAETLKALAGVTAEYSDYLYEENGLIKLNTKAWEENANAQMERNIAWLQAEITSLNEQNRILQEKNDALWESVEAYRAQSEAMGGSEAYDALIGNATEAIERNNEAIAENSALVLEHQGLLSLYGAVYADLTGNMSAYESALRNFNEVGNVIESVSSSYAGLYNLQQQVADGFTFSLDKILEYAKAYPEILDAATVTANGELALNEAVVNSFIDGRKAELDAQIDAQIADLEGQKAVLEAKKEFATVQLEMAKTAAEGEGKLAKELAVYRINAGNAIAEAMIENGVDEANAYRLAAAAMSQNIQEFSRVAAEVCTGVDGNFDNAAYSMAMSMYYNAGSMQRNLGAVASQAHELARAVAAAGEGVIAGAGSAIGGLSSGTKAGKYGGYSGKTSKHQGTELDLSGIGAGKGKYSGLNQEYTQSYNPKSSELDDFIAQLETEILDYSDAIANIDGQIAVLEALRNTPFQDFRNLVDNSNIVGDKTNSNTEQGQGQNDAEEAAREEEEAKKELVDEYIAAIDEYYEALKRLEEVQNRRASLEKKLSHTEDLSEKIFLSSGLIDAYKEEAAAQEALMAAKQATISANVGALRGLGFDVSYDAAANKLYIKNLEHLNELTAKTAGEYDTLQEATNALRKETEELIDTTEQLNDENIQASESIEDLGYEVLGTKNNIIDYIEEIYDKQADSYQKIIDLRKELIQSAKDEYDYEADIAEKVKEIADLQARIDQLALDDSRSAQAERQSLQQALLEKQEDLAKTQGDHATDAQMEALDKMAEDYGEQRAGEIEILRSTVTQSEELWDAFYQTILGNNASVGDSIDAHIANAWIRAAQAVNDYSAAMSGISSGGVVINTIPKYHTGGVVDEANLGKNEALAILQKGEVVLDEKKQDALYRAIDFHEELSRRMGKEIGSFTSLPSFTGGVGVFGSLVGAIADLVSANSQGLIFEPHISVEIHHSGNMTDKDARGYGAQIADTAIEKLHDAFARRGISGTHTARLRPQ